MKFINKYINKSFFCMTTVLFLLLATGCEGVDDWTDLEELKTIFDSKDDSKSDGPFKRYSIPVLSSEPLVEFVVDSKSKYSILYSKEIRKICDYTKIPYNIINLSSWNTAHKISATTRVLVIYDTSKLDDASTAVLLDFVSKGGTLFIPYAIEDRRNSFLIGIKPEALYITNIKASGWYFNTPFLPNLKGRSYLKDLTFYGFAAQNFSNKIKVLATALNDPSYPAIIENSIGNGKVLLYNTSGEFLKADRGFIFAGILKGLEGIPYPVANTATIFLDDFPSPQYDIKAEPIQSEMNLFTSDFVQKVWWPDMSALAKQYKIPYSAMLTFDYRNKIIPPFTLDQWNTRKIKTGNKVEALTDWLVNDVAKNKHELAFHGYNHVSLTKELWKNQMFIETSMNTVKKKWDISNYGKLPTTYVPPSNIIDKEGILQLKKAMPSLKYMCSLYLGQTSDGGNREFDYDPYHKDFFDYPRISSGFYLNDDERYNLQSMYLITGVWTHFVHPDDVYQIPATANKSAGDYALRNSSNLGWHKTKGSDNAMFPEFKKFMEQQTGTYPQMRFVSANDAGKIVMNWRASRYTHTAENGFFTVKEINPEQDKKQYWFMYGSPTNANRIESQLKSQGVLYTKSPFVDGYLYSVYSNKPQLKVIDIDYKGPREKAQQVLMAQQAKAAFNKYLIDVKVFRYGVDWNIEEREKMEFEDLKKKIFNSPVIDSVKWNKYAKKMSWDEKRDEVWKVYEDYVTNNYTKENVLYSKELDRLIGYPNDISREKWMSEQMKVTPKDTELLNSYIANYNTPENQDKIKSTLKALIGLDTTNKSYKNYIKHLLDTNPKEAREELKDTQPNLNLDELIAPIAWLFADNDEFHKAYEWAGLTKDIDFLTRMNWLIEKKDYQFLESEYLAYIDANPTDMKVKARMSEVYHELGRFKDSWKLANSMTECEEKETVRKILNTDVVFEKQNLQDFLISYESELFYPDILKKLRKENRLRNGNYIDVLSSVQTNLSQPAIFKNIGSYNFYDKKENIHSLGATYDKFYKIDIKKKYDSNYDNALTGVQYKYTTAAKDNKPQYWSRLRLAINQTADPYFQFGVGINYSKNKTFRSSEINFFPVENAAGMNQKIYQGRLNIYQEFYILKKINVNALFESNYYTNSFLSKDTIDTNPIINPNKIALSRQIIRDLGDNKSEVTTFDDAIDAAATIKFMYNDGEIKKSKLIPYLETQFSIGSRDLSIGYPYWMIKHRLYGGLGLGWELNVKNFTSKIEGGYFIDDFSKTFTRVTENATYQLFDYTMLTLNIEVFIQSKYYSNSVQFGLKHNLKKKAKKIFQ